MAADTWTNEEEGKNLKRRFEGRAQTNKDFVKEFALPGGTSMLSQHFSGHRPISLEAGQIYARAFGVPLEEISPRLAKQLASITSQTGGQADSPVSSYSDAKSKIRHALAVQCAILVNLPTPRRVSVVAQMHHLLDNPSSFDETIAEIESLLSGEMAQDLDDAAARRAQS